MALKILQAIPADMNSIREVQKLSWLETYPNEQLGITKDDISIRFASDDTEEGKRQMEQRTTRFFQPNARTWIVKDGDKTIGYCLAIKGSGSHRIQAIYLLTAYQGKGIGKQFMSKALNWLGKDKKVYLNVAEYNDKAILFYEHIGFSKTENVLDDEFIPLASGHAIHEIEMVLDPKVKQLPKQ